MSVYDADANEDDNEDAGVFRALASATRRQILQDLRGGELTAGEILSLFTDCADRAERLRNELDRLTEAARAQQLALDRKALLQGR